jgi:hypothetical protein
MMSEPEPVSPPVRDSNAMLHPAVAEKNMQMHYRRYAGREALHQYAPRAASSMGTVLAKMNRSEASDQFSI